MCVEVTRISREEEKKLSSLLIMQLKEDGARGGVLLPSSSSFGTMGKFLQLSDPCAPSLYNEANNTDLVGFPQASNEATRIKAVLNSKRLYKHKEIPYHPT